jgi:hypothetical protein
MTTDFYIISGSTVPKDYFWDIGNPLETTPTYVVADSTTTYISGYAPGLKVVFKSDIKDLIYAGFPDVSANYIWNFGDYYNSVDNTIALNCVDSTVEHTYILPGKYSVSLTNIQSKEDQPELPSSDVPCGGRHKIGWYWNNLDCGDLQATTWDETNCTLPQVADLKKRKPKRWDDEGKCFQRYCKNWTWKDLNCEGRNPVFWYETYEYGDYYKRWKYEANNIACNPRDIPKITVDVTEQVALKPFIVEVLEVKPAAIITCESYPLTGYSPFTYKLSPAQIKTGSFPIDRIDWDPGDGSSIKTVTRYTTPDSGYFVYNNIYFSDTNDPRNYDFVYTLKRNSDTYPVFYPSLTCYSASTNTTDSCSIVVGPILLQPQNTDIQLLKAKTTSKGDFYGIEVDKNVTVLSTLTENDVVVSPTPTVPPSPVKFLTKQTPVIYFGNTSEGYPPPYEPGCEYIPSEPTLFNLIKEETDPTFLRDFALNKTLNHDIGPDITFTRSSSATYFDSSGIIQTVNNNIPRFDHNPVTGESLGLLIEEQRTNFVGQQNLFSWTQSFNTLSAGSGIAGLSSFIIGDENNTQYSQVIYTFSPALPSATTYCFSCYVKKNTQFNNNNPLIRTYYSTPYTGPNPTAPFAGVHFNQATGVAQANYTTTSSVSVQDFNTYYRVSFTFNSQSSATTTAVQIVPSHGASVNLSGVGASALLSGTTIEVGGFQVERGVFPTSYIPTTTAAATRAADSAVVTPISSFYNQSEGTLFAEVWKTNNPSDAKWLSFVRLGDTTRNITITNYATSHNFAVWNGTSTSVDFSSAALNVAYKIAGAYKANDARAAQNGMLSGPNTSANPASNIDAMHLGSLGGVQFFLNNHIRRIAYWPERLPNERLQQLTQSDETYYSIIDIDDSILLEDETLLYK